LKPNEIEIRRATQADVRAIAKCVHCAYAHYVPMIGIPPMPMLDDYSAVVERAQVFVLMLAGELVGVVVLETTEEGFLLNNVAVHPRHKGKGFGGMLLQFAEGEAKRQGHDAIYLYTNVKMTDNQAIYAARGFVEYDRRLQNGRHGVFMRKRLA
jgi:N-acetylglutamate synthase-like GNAT family acetyltransferase